MDSTGYGPSASIRTRLFFDGDERKYELWEVKFLGFLKLQGLDDILARLDLDEDREVDAIKNSKIFAEIVQVLDDRSLSLIIRDARDDGRKSLQILRAHYKPTGKPRVITLYTQLTSLQKLATESVTDYIIRAETAAAALRDAGETISDSLLIAMVLKGLPGEFKSFTAVITQKDSMKFPEFKVCLRNFEDTDKIQRDPLPQASSVMQAGAKLMTRKTKRWCQNCKSPTHDTSYCRKTQQQHYNYKPTTTNTAAKARWCEICRSKSHDTAYCRKLSKVREVNITGTPRKPPPPDDDQHCVFMTNNHNTMQNNQRDVFLVDSGATVHIIKDRSMFQCFDETFDSAGHIIELADGTRLEKMAEAQGDATVFFTDNEGCKRNVILKNALYVPSFSQNIFSVQAATENGAAITFKEDSATLYSGGKTFPVMRRGKLYFISAVKHSGTKKVSHSLQEWHEIMGHCNVDDVKKLPSVVTGMKITQGREFKECTVCIESKMVQNRNRNPDRRATGKLDLVHLDLAGPIDPTAHDGFKYALCCVDDFTGLSMVYFLKEKSDTVHATEKFIADVSPYGKVKCMRTDNGGEFVSKGFELLLVKNQIKHEKSAPYSPHQNGTVERAWRTLFEMARCLLRQSGLPKTMWTYAAMASAYIRNRCFNSRTGRTPFEMFTGHRPNVSNMHVFGCVCYAYVQNPKKLDSRAEKGVFVGYDKGSPAYLVYFPETQSVKKVRCVKFTSDRFEPKSNNDNQSQSYPEVLIDDTLSDIPKSSEESECEEMKSSSNANENSESRRGYSQRPKTTPKYLDDYVVGNVNDDHLNVITHYCYAMKVPTTYKEAMNSQDADKWQQAMDDEMNALGENDTFEITTLPPGRKAVGGKWVYALKSSPNGEERHKARFVAKGYSQIPDVDYQETFSPTARMTSVRTLIELAVQSDWIVHQMDVKAAYLNAPIDVELYVEQPEGYEVKSKSGDKLVLKLKKSLYGLKQSGRNWNIKLHTHLIELGFVQSQVDHCVYTKHSSEQRGDHAVIVVWVDDIIIAANSQVLMNSVKAKMSMTFNMKDLGALSWFLGIQFTQSNGTITMSQSQYIERLLSKFGMQGCKPKYTTCDVNLNKFCDEPAKVADEKLYKEIVGSLIYIMTATRPDLCYIVTRLSQYMACPTQNHMIAAKHVLRYLKATIDQKLIYRKSESSWKLVGACDADWGNCSDRKSITGYGFLLTDKGPMISWKSKKQQTVALSTCEAEYMAMCAATQEGNFLQALIKDMMCSDHKSNFTLQCDNQGAIAMSKNPVSHQRSKHIDIKYHFVRNQVQNGTINIVYVPTSDNWADLFTKPVSRAKLQMFRPILSGEKFE